MYIRSIGATVRATAVGRLHLAVFLAVVPKTGRKSAPSGENVPKTAPFLFTGGEFLFKCNCPSDCIEAVIAEPSLKGPLFRAIVERTMRQEGTLAPLVVKNVSDAIALVKHFTVNDSETLPRP